MRDSVAPGRWGVVSVLALTLFLSWMERSAITYVLQAMGSDLRWSSAQIASNGSLLFSVFFVGYGLSLILLSGPAQRMGPVRSLTIVVVCSALVTMASAVAARSLAAFVALRLLLGIVEGVHVPMTIAIVRAWFPENERARANSACVAGVLLAGLFGPWVSIEMSEWLGWQAAIAIIGGLGLVSMPLLYRMPKSRYGARAEAPESLGLPLRAGPREIAVQPLRALDLVLRSNTPRGGPLARLRTLIAVGVIANFCMYGILSWLPTYFQQAFALKLEHGLVLAVLVPNIASLAGLMLMAFLGDRSGDRTLVGAAGFAGAAIFLGPAILCGQMIWAVALFAAVLFFLMAYAAQEGALISALAPEQDVGQIAGVYNGISMLIGGSAGTWVVGQWAAHAGDVGFGLWIFVPAALLAGGLLLHLRPMLPGRAKAITAVVFVILFMPPLAARSENASTPVPPLAARYALAERFIFWNADDYVKNAQPEIHWIGGEDRFWYRRSTANGSAIVVVDAVGGKRQICIEGNSSACGDHRIRESRGVATDAAQSISPDGRWAVFLRDHNLWARSTGDGREFALTADGTEHNAYGVSSGNNTHFITDARKGQPARPLVVWSPDSRRILTHQLDDRAVGSQYLLQSVPEDGEVRGKLWSFRYALPGDAHKPLESLLVVDMEKRSATRVDAPPIEDIYVTAIEDQYVWWSSDGSHIYWLAREPYSKGLSLNQIDPVTGNVRHIIHETSETFAEIAEELQWPRTRILKNGDVVWFSERSGFGHLYLYRADGRLKRQLTRGAWSVRDIVMVDEERRRVYFTGSGREADSDPTFQHLYSVGLDGRYLQLLTPEDAEHRIAIPAWSPVDFAKGDGLAPYRETNGISKSGRYFVDTYSRPDLPPVTVLRSTDGALVCQLEAADVSKLQSQGFRIPTRFEVTAADGRTKLYGTLFKPSYFQNIARYPVVDSIYPGPQLQRVHKNFMDAVFDFFESQSIAELGFIVVTVDGRGTPHRSKLFLNESYGQLRNAGHIDDHVAAIKELGQRYAFMDMSRIGVVGESGGGYASTRAIFEYPDFYKVAVSSSGNHDQRGYLAAWAETYNGVDDGQNYLDAANAALASRLNGKLLLVHGEMDDNVPPALTMKVVDALIKSNKDFDMLIIPNANHYLHTSAYFMRRRWNYLTKNLLQEEPPAYEIRPH